MTLNIEAAVFGTGQNSARVKPLCQGGGKKDIRIDAARPAFKLRENEQKDNRLCETPHGGARWRAGSKRLRTHSYRAVRS